MLRTRWRLTLAVSVVALECTMGGIGDSGQECPEGPVMTPPSDCSSSIGALTLSASADTIPVGRGVPLAGQITSPSAPGLNCMYFTSLSTSDSTVASLLSTSVTFSPYSSSGFFSEMPIGAVIGRGPGTATITHRGGAGSAPISLTVIPPGDAYVAVSAGSGNVCTLDPAGRVYCTAGNTSPAPLLVDGVPALASVEAGSVQSCGLSVGKQVICWPVAWSAPVLGAPSQVVLPAEPAAVDASGNSHSCALTAAHDAYCWGSNMFGQLGAPGDYGYWVANGNPVAVAGEHKFRKVSTGGDHTCGLGDDGSLWCWGNNLSGELGLGAVDGGCGGYSQCQPTPARIRLAADSVFTDVAAGSDHTCALDAAGGAYCWGRNASGALGTADTLSGSTPRKVAGSLVFVALTAGLQYTCGLTASGDAYCWGANDSGQLGSGTTGGSCGSAYYTTPCETAPVNVSGGLRFSSLSAGASTTCGMASDGAWCWGNYQGSNGHQSNVPVRVSGQR